MEIIQAKTEDFDIIKAISHETIKAVYPHYYPKGAVDYFLAHHSDENIMKDIYQGRVYFLKEEQGAVGTVTIKENEVCRLFVLPQFQKMGYGSILLEFAEREIAKEYQEIHLAASFPAKSSYLKRGYREESSYSILTENGDYLCYDEMKKNSTFGNHKMNYDGKEFVPERNSENGEVDGQTVFYYHQSGNIIWAEYTGGEIIKGHLIGTVSENGALDFFYQHINGNMEVRIGKCHSVPKVIENGKTELHEEWQWLNGDKSAGSSIIVER